MKAIIYRTYGTADVLQLVDLSKPPPNANELLIRIHAAAVNHGDRHILGGLGRMMGDGLFRPKNPRLGADMAGVVEAVGSAVTRFQPGDAVFGDLSAAGRGAFAEYALVSQEAPLALKPEQISFEEAAAVPLTGVTALQGLRDYGGLVSGQRVLINGASGGVGTFAVQIAKALGAEVTAVASTGNLELVRNLGADYLIDYTQEDFIQGDQPFDLILDTVGNRPLADIRSVLTETGRFVTTTFMPAVVLQGKWHSRTSSQKFHNMMARANAADLAYLAQLMQGGQLRPVIDRCFPLPATAEAVRYLENGHPKGKVLITLKTQGEARR